MKHSALSGDEETVMKDDTTSKRRWRSARRIAAKVLKVLVHPMTVKVLILIGRLIVAFVKMVRD